MSNLAVTLSDQGKINEVAVVQQDVLQKRLRILGDKHLDTITAMSNFALTLSNQGKIDEAANTVSWIQVTCSDICETL
jgi:hypothetical protein